jgi:hypothetical protein
MTRWEYALVMSAFLMLTGLFLVLDGHVLGERTVGVASVLGLAGMLLMLMSGVRVAMERDQHPVMTI